MRETLASLTPQLRRYAHALLGAWPCAPSRGDDRPRADQEADDIVQCVLLGFLRASADDAADPAQSLRLTLYRRVTALAREKLARRRFEEVAAAAADSGFAPRHYAWAPEARALPLLSPNLRALLALVALERLTYVEVAEVLDMQVDQVLPLLAVARAQLAGAISGVARTHLTQVAAASLRTPGSPVIEADLHLFVDELLDRARAHEISAWLESQPEASRRVGEWRRTSERLRASFRPLVEEPLPLSLNFSTPDAAFWSRRRNEGRKFRRRHFFSRLAKWVRHFAPLGERAHA